MPPDGLDTIPMFQTPKRVATTAGHESRRADGATPITAAGQRGSGDGDRSNTAIITRTKPKTKRPSLYRVLLLNDDYTPMEFVVHVVERFFNKSHDDAYQIMMHVHQNGVGECGVFTRSPRRR